MPPVTSRTDRPPPAAMDNGYLVLGMIAANQTVDPLSRVALRAVSASLREEVDLMCGMPDHVRDSDLRSLWLRVMYEERRSFSCALIWSAVDDGRVDALELLMELRTQKFIFDIAWRRATGRGTPEVITFLAECAFRSEFSVDWLWACTNAAECGRADLLRTLVELIPDLAYIGFPEDWDHDTLNEWAPCWDFVDNGDDSPTLPEFDVCRCAAESGDVETLECALSLGFEFKRVWFAPAYARLRRTTKNGDMIAFLENLELGD